MAEKWQILKRRSTKLQFILSLLICVHLIVENQASSTLPQQESTLARRLARIQASIPTLNQLNTEIENIGNCEKLTNTKTNTMEMLPTLKIIGKKRHRDHNHLLARCTIEITNKIVGICQTMGNFGNACVSGDYVDIFNESCQ